MRKFTEKGRVVYDRKKHVFRLSDSIRVSQKVGLQLFRILSDQRSDFLSRVYDIISDLSVDIVQKLETPIFGPKTVEVNPQISEEIPEFDVNAPGFLFIIEESEE